MRKIKTSRNIEDRITPRFKRNRGVVSITFKKFPAPGWKRLECEKMFCQFKNEASGTLRQIHIYHKERDQMCLFISNWSRIWWIYSEKNILKFENKTIRAKKICVCKAMNWWKNRLLEKKSEELFRLWKPGWNVE